MSDNDLEQAKTCFLRGLQAFEAADWAQAQTHFEQALVWAPGRTSVMQNLGITRLRLGRYAEAEPLLRTVLAAEPDQADAWQALALTQLQLQQLEEACGSYERCFALGMRSAELYAQYAQCLTRQGRIAEALQAYQDALARDANHVPALTELGSLYREAGLYDKAAHCFRQALAQGADPDIVGYFLAAVTKQEGVSTPPRQYVQQLFDEYAGEFDAHLVTQLGYRGHQALIDRLPPTAGPRFSRALDLGCGTGLCGAYVRSRVDDLAGVDLSPAMVEKARQRAVYDSLYAGDLCDFLAQPQAPYDLVLAADVFIYVGALDRVFGLLATRMHSGSWLAFTVEAAAAAQSVELLPSLRYAHSAPYLEELAQRHGFETMAVHDEPIRFDQQRAVQGQYIYLKRR
jgi:predicted TPR repeat methyltransferase